MSSAYIRVKEVRDQVPGTTCNGAHTNCDKQLPDLWLRKGARILRSTLREWRAGTTLRAKGGRPGTTAAVPRRHLLASHP